MNFQILYFLVPLLLFIVSPTKVNRTFVIYILLLAVLSYDNVTDYGFFIKQFRDIRSYGSLSHESLKGLEGGWSLIYKAFSFTEYGFVIIHSLTFVFLIYTFLLFSNRIGLLNVSIFLCFFLEAFTKHDNIMRQNIAIVFAFYAFFDVLRGGGWSKGRIFKLGLMTLAAFLFHYSAILLIPFYFFINWMKNKHLNWGFVFCVVFVLNVVRMLGYSRYIILAVLMLNPMSETDYVLYYLEEIINSEANEVSVAQFVYMFLAVTPLFYFTVFRKAEYKRNTLLRLSVNLTCITISWRAFFMDFGFFTRVVDYFLWFEIWGVGYMIKDLFSYKRLALSAKMFGYSVLFIICFKHWGVLNNYYGENNYMTVLSEECRFQQVYDRDANVSKAIQIRDRH